MTNFRSHKLGLARVALFSLAVFGICFIESVHAQPAPAAADIGARLDAKLDVTIRGMEIENVLADLAKQSGVDITLDEDAVETLPWGKQTKLSDVTIANSTLRAALPQVLEPLGLTYIVRDNKIVVTATDPLERMRRRPTWDELKRLKELREKDYSPEAFAALKVQYRITGKVDAKAMLQHQLDISGRGTMSDMLETATKALNWVWYIEDDHVVVRTLEAQNAAQLSRQVSVRYTNVPLAQILSELGDKAGVTITFDPGMMLKLPPSTAQSYTLLLQSVSVKQALELICAETGLKYEVRPDSIHMSLSEAVTSESGKAAVARTSPYIAKISVPSPDGTYSMEFLIRAEDLPPEILEARSQMLQEMIQKIRRDIAPAPSPATPGK
ncbi:MAG TPA: DUF4974 domain-containing protein [Phycisphaerae bacterium]|nr:DUF4974 domain-containing protein [Phycisphaerae bacterium]